MSTFVAGLSRLTRAAKRCALRQQIAQNAEPLGRKLCVHGRDTGQVAAGVVEAGDEALLNRIAPHLEDDRNAACRGLGRSRGSIASRCCDDGNAALGQIHR
jgi:hypothetical protein